VKYKIIISDAVELSKAEEAKEKFQKELNELIGDGWKLTQFDFPNASSSHVYHALLQK